MKKKVFSIIYDVILILLALLVVGLLVLRINYSGFYIVGDSMLPTLVGAEEVKVGSTTTVLSGGDYIYVNKNKYPDYGDIVVINASYTDKGNSETKIIVKRVIAKEGDRIKIVDGKLYVWFADREDYTLIEEDYILDKYNQNNTLYLHLDPVPEGCIFVLGDNRDISNDSRGSFGDIPLENVCGVLDGFSSKIIPISTGWYTFWHYTVKGWFND